MTPTDVYGLVLAGGRSRRMGHDKALLQRDGETQLERMTALLRRHCGAVFVSTRADQAHEPERARFAQIIDRYDGIGPAAGILSAMDEHPDVDWLVVACDLPNVDDTTLGALLGGAADDATFCAFRSAVDGLPEPLCALYRRGGGPQLRRFVDEGLRCPRKMLIRADAQLLDLPDAAALDNVNTPDDLATSSLETRS